MTFQEKIEKRNQEIMAEFYMPVMELIKAERKLSVGQQIAVNHLLADYESEQKKELDMFNSINRSF